MSIKCPEENLESLLDFINPIIFYQIIYESPPSNINLSERFPDLSCLSLAYIHREIKIDYCLQSFEFIKYLSYFSDFINRDIKSYEL